MVYRCSACGNRTRFDVFETSRTRRFHHYSLGGDLTIDEEEILAHEVESVVCRWCGSSSSIEELALEDIPADDPGPGSASKG